MNIIIMLDGQNNIDQPCQNYSPLAGRQLVCFIEVLSATVTSLLSEGNWMIMMIHTFQISTLSASTYIPVYH